MKLSKTLLCKQVGYVTTDVVSRQGNLCKKFHFIILFQHFRETDESFQFIILSNVIKT